MPYVPFHDPDPWDDEISVDGVVTHESTTPITAEVLDYIEAGIENATALAEVAAGGGGAYASGDKILFVSKSGNDSNDGLSPSSAKLTITAAITAVGRGKIHVGAGTYTETIDLTGLYQIWLVGQGGNGAQNLGSVIRAPGVAEAAIYLSSNGGNHIVEGFTLQGYETGDVYTGKILNYAGGQGYCTFRNLMIYGQENDVDGGVYGGTGVYVKNTEQNVFDNIVIQQCNLGLYVDATSPGGTNSKNTFSNVFFGPCYKIFKEFESPPGTPTTNANVYSKWKSSGAWIDMADGWAIEMNGGAHICDSIDFSEITGPAFPSGATGKLGWKINCFGSFFRGCANATTTQVSVTGSDNLFQSWQTQDTFTIESSAYRTTLDNPMGQGMDASPGTTLVNNGVGTRVRRLLPGGFTDNGLATQVGDGPPPVSANGRWFATPTAPQSSVVAVANRMYLVPLWVPESTRSLSLALHVVTGAAGNAEVGLYAAGVDNQPGAYMWPVGDPTSTAAPGNLVFTNWRGHVGVGGLLWLAVCCNAAPTFLGVATGSAPTPFVGDSTLATLTGGASQAYYVAAAYNAVFPYLGASTASVSACGDAPTIFYKYAA